MKNKFVFDLKLWRAYLISFIVIVLVVLFDQITKVIFYGSEFSVIPTLIGVRETGLNTGGAWSILDDKMWLLILFSLIFLIVAIIFNFIFKSSNIFYSISFGFILGGTIGNLIDRLFFGGVRDFIYFEFMPSYPTFNIADSFLLFGMIFLLIFVLFLYKPKDKEKNKK